MRLVSIVIPAYNDAERLEKTLQQLQIIREQEYSALEVVVAVRPSEDATLEVANRFADTVVPGGTVSRGRNSGAAAARGEVIIFMDADTTPSVGVISQIAKRVTKQSIGSVPVFTIDPKFRARFAMGLTNTVRRLGIIKGMSNLLFCHSSLLHEKNVWYDETLSLGEHHDFIRRARAAGAKFTFINAKPGYTVCLGRYREWGYVTSFLFWMHWAIRKMVLRKDVKKLERAYWSKTYQLFFVQPQDWKKSGVFLLSTLGVWIGILLSITSYTGPRRVLLHLFLLELQEDPQAPLVHFWLWMMGQMQIETVYGIGLFVILGSFMLLVSTVKNSAVQPSQDLAKVIEK